MKKAKFLSGFNAKMALAAVAVASFTLTGCEKEDFSVNVPNIDIEVPVLDVNPGTAAIMLTATSTSGNTLEGITYTFTSLGGEVAPTTINCKSGETYVIWASKEGYAPAYKEIVVPTLPNNAFVTIPVNFVLAAIVSDGVEEVVGEEEINPSDPNDAEREKTQNFGSLKAGEVMKLTYEIPANGAIYMSDTQRSALIEAVDALSGPTRSADDEAAVNLETAKRLLKSKINEFASEPATVTVEREITVEKDASEIKVVVKTNQMFKTVEFSTVVANETYSVEGQLTVCKDSEVIVEADGAAISHGHGHGHGDGETDGGGIGDR